MPAAAAGLLATLALVLHWRGSDLPAQLLRANLFRHYGFVLWNSQWYGGHATLNYSVLAPMLSAFLGTGLVGLVSAVVSAALFDRIAQRTFGAGAFVAAVWFAVGTLSNLVVGRITFGLGGAFALGAVLAIQRRQYKVAGTAAIGAALASPVAGVFLALAAAAVMLTSTGRRRIAGVAIAVAAVGPLLIVNLIFPSSGSFPYTVAALLRDVAVAIVVGVAAQGHRTLRWGTILYGVSAVACFVVANPMGGNLSRLAQTFGGPLVVCLLWHRRRAVVLALAVPLLAVQWVPAVDGMTAAGRDESTERSYYTPLVSYLASIGATTSPNVGRIEVPFTHRHWEAVYVADALPMARGWERQLDIAYNPAFYDGTLSADTYHEWLSTNGVEFVALPDTQLDRSSAQERSLLESALPYLQRVWGDAHWTLWRVSDFHSLVVGDATLLSMSPNGFTLDMNAAGSVAIRIRASSHWAVSGGGCATSDDTGWMRLEGLPAGTVQVTQAWVGTPCHDS